MDCARVANSLSEITLYRSSWCKPSNGIKKIHCYHRNPCASQG